VRWPARRSLNPLHLLGDATITRLFERPDLVGKHANVERARRLVLVHVLALGLVALHEIPLRLTETARAPQANLHDLGYDVTRKFTPTTTPHLLSSNSCSQCRWVLPKHLRTQAM
jgi:hypothetical protein